MRRTGTGTVAALLGLGLGAGLGACGDGATTARDPGAGAPPGAPSTTPAEAAEASCPKRLPQPPPEAAATADAPASAAPALPVPERAWRCRYVAGGGGGDGGGGLVWTRTGRPEPLDTATLPVLAAGLDRLAPAAAGRFCTQELGARWLLVLVSGDDLTGVVVDDFGCHDVRLTDDPAAVAPGTSIAPGVVPGVLGAPGVLVDVVTTGQSARTTGPAETAPPG